MENCCSSTSNSDIPWASSLAKYQHPSLARSLWQLVNTLVPYLFLWWAMLASLQVSYWLTLGLALIAAGFVLRIFIIFHDCTHGAFFKSQAANNFVGRILSVPLFTSYRYWQHEHNRHHASAGNLDDRGVGDIWTMTVAEYLKAPKWEQIKYRFFRHPLVLFVFGPPILFLFRQRFVQGPKKERERKSVYYTNIGILIYSVIMSLIFGWKTFLLIQIPVIAFASCAGVWMFYVQHQFEGVYWERDPKWNFVDEALYGSSFYKLPKLLQWMTGNIGFHHVHHLSPKIPNYYLEAFHNSCELFKKVPAIGFWASLKSLHFRLWDERNKRLISFKELPALLGAY